MFIVIAGVAIIVAVILVIVVIRLLAIMKRTYNVLSARYYVNPNLQSLVLLPRDALQCRACISCDRMSSDCQVSTLFVCDVGGSGSHRLEILETNCTVN